MVLLALVVLVRGGEADQSSRPAADAPRIVVAQPTGGTSIQGPLELIFRVDADLRRQPSGWGTGELHLHLEVDGQEYMPAPGDIQPLASGAYRWTFGRLKPGPHALRLFWSDAEHLPVPAGGSTMFQVHVR